MAVKVSVIIPVYNAELFLSDTISSVLNQSFRDLELICVDDGSNDSSVDIIKKFCEVDPRVTLLCQPHLGAGAARNRGMDVACGDYYSFLDSDDIFNSEMIEKAYNRIEEDGADIVIFKSNQFDQVLKEYRSAEWALKKHLISNKTIFNPTEYSDNIFQFCNGWPWDKLFRASLVKDNKLCFQNTHFFNDTYFVFSALVVAKRISVLDEVLATKRVNLGQNQISNNRSRYWIDFEDVVDGISRFLELRGERERYEYSFQKYLVHIALVMIDTTTAETIQHLKMFIKSTYRNKINYELLSNKVYSKSEE